QDERSRLLHHAEPAPGRLHRHGRKTGLQQNHSQRSGLAGQPDHPGGHQPESGRRAGDRRDYWRSAAARNRNLVARPFPALGDIQFLENRVLPSYHSMQVRVEKRSPKALTFLGSYTWGKALTLAPDPLSTSGVGAGFDVGTFREPQNPNNLRAERGLAE